tara:strand:+ start:276 stop:1760 length:1485 start_codon:yes stop_codon:yes gene_type:complete
MKLAFIIPTIKTDDEESMREKLFYHIEYFLKDIDNLDWKLFFVEQLTKKQLNWGKCFNIGAKFVTTDDDFYNYLVFQDLRLEPIFDNNIYNAVDKPMHLGYSFIGEEEYSEESSIDDFYNDTPLYDTYMGGSMIIPSKLFELVNGFSNKYWGYGFHDDDFFERIKIFNLPTDVQYTKDVELNYINLNGETSYGKFVENEVISELFNDSFTINAKFMIDKKPTHTVMQDNNRCEYQLICRPGYHTGISITNNMTVKLNVFDIKNKLYSTEIRIQPKTWYDVSWSYNSDTLLTSFYVNGRIIKSIKMAAEIKNYDRDPLYVGVGNPKGNMWRSYFKGKISNISIYKKYMDASEIDQLFTYGVVSLEEMRGIVPVTYVPFKSGYKNMSFDMSENLNHLRMLNCDISTGVLKRATIKNVPYRSRGIFRYCGNVMEDYVGKKSYTNNKNNYKILTETVNGGEEVVKSDGLSNLRFRLLKRFQTVGNISLDKAEILSVQL